MKSKGSMSFWIRLKITKQNNKAKYLKNVVGVRGGLIFTVLLHYYHICWDESLNCGHVEEYPWPNNSHAEVFRVEKSIQVIE